MRTIVENADTASPMTNYLLTIVGPTAIGKTALGIALARHFKTEIISSDSRQFYKEMKIGTAVPEPEELQAAKHHFIQHISVRDNYSVGHFERDALDKLDELFKKHRTVVMVGGSGLYTDAVLYGLDHFPKVDSEIRKDLKARFKEGGIATLQKRLKDLDPVTYKKIDLDNPQRVIRALEICIGTGKPFSSFQKNSRAERDFTPIKIGLTADRAIIYERIDKRVDLMVQNGLVEEARSLLPYKHLNALNTVGYKELFAYFEGAYTLDFAIAEIKKNTRRFAKRQLTWYRKDEGILWFDYGEKVEKVVETVNRLVV